jgi:ArsR family transcriptional regulator, lead/cadmium/zinc/bismuth-responsive transcriptional repressor
MTTDISELALHLPSDPGDRPGCDTRHVHSGTIAGVREDMISEGEVIALAETFRALGDSTRVRILDALSKAELCVCDLAALLSLSESAVSHQLRLLRGMRLVRPRREGRLMFYALDDHHILDLFRQGLDHVVEASRSGLRGPQPRPPAPSAPRVHGAALTPAGEEPDEGMRPERRWE